MMRDLDKDLANIKHATCIIFSTSQGEILYQPETKKGLSRLNCHSLAKIRSDQDLKVMFWHSLQALFPN